MERDNESIVQQIQSGQGNRDKLLERLWTDNLGLIRKIIHNLTGLDRNNWNDRQDFEDLEQQAFIGIMESIPKYDSNQEMKFFSFATYYIRKSVYRYYDRSCQRMRIPAYMRKRIREYMNERDKLQESTGSATDEMLQKILGWSDKAIRETTNALQRMETLCLDNYVNENGKESVTLLDMIAGTENTSETALVRAYDTELHELLQCAMQGLSDRERQAINCKHFQGLSDRHTASIMNCSYQYVQMLRKSAYKKIRTGKYGNKLLDFLPEHSISKGQRKIQDDFKELSQQERDLLI